MSRKWLLPSALLLLLALGGGAAAWQVAAARLEAGVALWTEARRAEGWRIAHAPARRGGPPWRPAVTLRGFEAVSPVGLGARAGTLAVALSPLRPRDLLLEASGPLALAGGGSWVPVAARTATGAASLLATRVLWTLDDATLDDARGGGAAARRVALLWDGQQLRLDADSARIGALALDSATLRLDAAGALLRLLGAEARRGAATATLSGEATLDAAGRPEGAGRLVLDEPAEAVRLLREAGLLAPETAGPVALLAQLGARVPPGGGPPRLDLPVELRGGRLLVARLPVATLPTLRWR